MLIARFKHVAMPQFEQVTDRPLRGVNGPAARWDTELIAVGAVRGSSKCGSLNISEWLQPRNRIPASKPRRGGIPRAEPVDYEVRPLSIGKGTGQSTDGARQGRGPSAQTRIVEITLGKTDLPAGADSNLRRLIERGKPESVRGIWVWRMSSSERRRRSNVLPNGPRSHYRRGNATTVQRGSRHLVGMGATPVGTLSSIQPVRVSICVEPSSKLERSGAYASQRLSFDPSGKARWGKAKVANRTREIRLSGMKTGARGNVTHGGTVNPSRNRKGVAGNPLPNSARAPALSKPWLVRFQLNQSRAGRLEASLATSEVTTTAMRRQRGV